MSFSYNGESIYLKQTQLQKSVDRIKSNIRLRRERQIMLNNQRSYNSKTNLQGQQKTQSIHYQKFVNEKQQIQEKKYNICLNNEFQLFPVVKPVNGSMNGEATIFREIPDLNSISTFTSLSNLVNLYNLIRQGYYNQAPYIIITLIQKVLQQIECKFITLNEIFCHTNNKLDYIRSSMRNYYQQNEGIAIMLLIIYKQLENKIAGMSSQSQHIKYRRKLIQICDRYRVLDVKMLGVFGVNSIKSIQY